MAKYVCDFDTVIAAGDSICSIADDISEAVSNYSTGIKGLFAGDNWSGTASESFEKVNEGHIQASNNSTEDLRSLGEFIKEAAQKIQKVEEDLAALKI